MDNASKAQFRRMKLEEGTQASSLLSRSTRATTGSQVSPPQKRIEYFVRFVHFPIGSAQFRENPYPSWVHRPRLIFLRLVSKNDFWCASWGERPETAAESVALVERLVEDAPAMVPVYRNCYINGRDIRLLSFDLAGFFRDMEFTRKGALRPRAGPKIDSPPWAATSPRKDGGGKLGLVLDGFALFL
ncbi:hypothetical protein SAY87_028053 [Trapa incisa]|uniref:Uncharacterized protein n=1 Tax=Trapa incisa TaxID=236973 RepID=A0AAN7KUX8_9MYRT|nr:hypothetical protein SAY87_028053 [Trapa incisa]